MSLTPNQIHYSLALLGFVLANIIALILSGKFEGDKASDLLFIVVWGNTYHIHHLMVGMICIIGILIVEQYLGKHVLISLFKGFSLGLIFHGLSYYNDYFSIKS